jgi:hypothetical protein
VRQTVKRRIVMALLPWRIEPSGGVSAGPNRILYKRHSIRPRGKGKEE